MKTLPQPRPLSSRPDVPFSFNWEGASLSAFLGAFFTALIGGAMTFGFIGWVAFPILALVSFPCWLGIIFASEKERYQRELPLGSASALELLEDAQLTFQIISRFSYVTGLPEDSVVKACLSNAAQTIASLNKSFILLEKLRAREAEKGFALDTSTHLEALSREVAAFKSVSHELDAYVQARYSLNIPRPGELGILDKTRSSIDSLHGLESRVMYARQLSESFHPSSGPAEEISVLA